MKHAIICTFAAAALLLLAANAPAVGQNYNPYITVDAPKQLSKKRSKRATTTGASSAAAKKKPKSVFDYEDDVLPAGDRVRRRQNLRSR